VEEEANRALVGEIYRRLNVIDLDVVERFHPDAEWHWPAGTPEQSVFRGQGEVRKGLMLWRDSWDDFRMEPEEMIEEDDFVFVLTRYRARGAGSGVEVDDLFAHLFRIREGLVTGWWMFGNTAKARRRFLAGDRPA
jgi:ketosteroid isomerase-like protein